jgi:hypothetical protein
MQPKRAFAVWLWIKRGKLVLQIAATLFFSLIFISAAAAIQTTVKSYWAEIVAALKGELGVSVRLGTTATPAPRQQRQRAIA